MTSFDPGALGDGGAALITGAGVLVAAAIWLTTRAWRPAMPVLLEFLLAAGLLRLSATDDWHAIAAAAAIAAIRLLLGSTAPPAAGRPAAEPDFSRSTTHPA